jgi:hypothetical protein
MRVRDRLAWRRLERAAVIGYRDDQVASLGSLTGLPVLALSATATGTVTLAVPGWRVGLAGVGGLARANLVALARRPCHVADSGRYGPFWWLAVTGGASPVVVLGSRVRLQPSGGGFEPPPPCALTPPDTRKEYSRS